LKTRTQNVQNKHENKYLLCLTYAKMNMKKTWQDYGAKSCLKLMLNELKEMRGLTPIYTPLGI